MNRPKTYILPLLFSLLVATSCLREKKETVFPTTITGQVVTKGTDEPIRHPPVRVQIVERKATTTLVGGGATYHVVTDTMTGKDHTFSLSAHLDPSEQYYLAVDGASVKRKHHYISPSYGSIDHESRKITARGGHVQMNYNLSAYGWVEFHFISENPQPGDVFSYNLGGGAYEEFYGTVNAVRTWDFAGNSRHDAYYSLRRNEEYIFWEESLLPAPFDTMKHEVRF